MCIMARLRRRRHMGKLGKLTKSSIANLVPKLRDYLISTGQIKEHILTPIDLYYSRQIALFDLVFK
jgi:hypothetical protein